MNENYDPTLEIGISGTGLSEEDTTQAIENIKEADIAKGLEITEPDPLPEEALPEEVNPEVVEEKEKGPNFLEKGASCGKIS